MRNENLHYQSEGEAMHGRLFWDEKATGPRPAVLVFPEGLGISDHTYGYATRLVEQGYVALACDYYGGGYYSQSLKMDDETTKRMHAIIGNTPRTRARAQDAFKVLAARPEVDKTKIAAIGFCFGGTMALELAFAGAPLVAAVGLHSGLGGVTTSDAKNVRGRLLICLGAEDDFVPPEQRTKFEAALKGTGVKWQLNLYGGQVHSFTNPKADSMGNPALRYDKRTEQDSWHSMMRLFKEVFGA